MTAYTSTNIAEVIASEVHTINTAGLNSCLLVTQGGTTHSAGSVLIDLTEPEVELALADGNEITSIAQTYSKPDALIGIFKSISAMESISLATENTTWSSGSVSFNTSAHDIPTEDYIYARLSGFVPESLNGDRLVAVINSTSWSFDLAIDPGAVTTEGTVSLIHATITAHGFPLNVPIHTQYTGVSKSAINGEHLTIYIDANNAYFPFDSVAGTIGVTSAKARVAKLTLINNGLANGTPLPIYITGVIGSAFNGAKIATVIDDDMYFAVNAVNTNPNKNSAKISYVIVDVAGALSETVGAENIYSLSANLPVTYNNNWDSVVTDSNTFVFAPATDLGAIITKGKVLDLDAEILRKMKVSFFGQKTGLRVSILECGAGTISDGVSALESYLLDNPLRHHAIVLPNNWDIAATATMTFTHSDSLNDFGVFFMPVSSYENQALFVGQKQVSLCSESNNAGHDEYLAAAAAALFVYQTATPQNKLATFTYADLTGFTPYSFVSQNDTVKKEFDSRGIMYVVDQSEGGSANACVYNGVCQGKDDFGNWIDLSSIWAKNYMIVTLDKAFAKFLFDNRTNPDMRFSLNDSGGQLAIRQTVSVAQSQINNFADSGVCEPATVQFIEYFRWKAANPALQAAKDLSNNLSVTTSVARGLFKITFNLGVSF